MAHYDAAADEGMTPEEVRTKLAIARKVTQDAEIGWLVGKGSNAYRKHNAYGWLSQADFDKMIVDYIEEKVQTLHNSFKD
ncbi:MAG: hypothetical protein R2883_03850 [Caldisericia bacterium]